MGTRGLVGVKIDGKYHGWYNHMDSYPEGLGEEVATFIRKHLQKPENVEAFRNAVRKIEWVTEDNPPSLEVQQRYTKAGLWSGHVSTGQTTEWYALLRQAQGADALPLILSGTLGHVLEYIDFIESSLFCEYAYILDLDLNQLALYKGFQKTAQAGNPFGDEQKNGYYPCANVAALPFDSVPASLERYFSEEESEGEEKEYTVTATITLKATSRDEAVGRAAVLSWNEWTLDVDE
jgi:hypothetical protein